MLILNYYNRKEYIPMGELDIFAIRIKQLRESLKMTQREFSKHISIKQQTLSGYERGIIKPPLDIAKNIAEKCNISIDWLCGLSNKKTSSNIPQTLADIFEILFLIQEYSDIQIYAHEGTVYIRNHENAIIGGEKSIIHTIGFQPYTIDEFINDWRKMLDALLSETIDQEIYELWKEKTLKKTMSYLPDGTEIKDNELP